MRKRERERECMGERVSVCVLVKERGKTEKETDLIVHDVKYRSLLQNIVSFIELFCKRDL